MGSSIRVNPERETVVDLGQYLEATLREADEAIAEMRHRRRELALRKAVIDAASDPELQRVADEVYELLEAGAGIPDARPAADVLAEAHRRFVG